MKVKTIISTSAADTFKSADGLLNFDAVFKLQAQVADLMKKATKAGKDVKATGYYVISTKAKPVQYSAALQKKDDLKYQTRRATKVAMRKTVKPESLAKVKILIAMVEGADVPAALKTRIKSAVAAINQHINKIEKVKAVITKKKDKIRVASGKQFDAAVSKLTAVLIAGGVKEQNIIESQGMMGKSVLVKLDADTVISIGKADITRFNAARKAAAATK
jgi:hypothetical protein